MIVRADVRHQVRETNAGNNEGVSPAGVRVTVPVLGLGAAPSQGNLAAGTSAYYRVEVAAGQALVVNLKGATGSVNEVFVRYAAPPSLGQFDFTSSQPLAADQRVLIPTTRAGMYYVLVYSDAAGVDNRYSIEAHTVGFAVFDQVYGQGGTAGNRTIEINGAKFDRTVTAALRGASGAELAATDYYRVNEAKLYATFDLTKVAAGVYDVVVRDLAGHTAVVGHGLEVVAGGGGQLTVSRQTPPVLPVPRHDPPLRFSFTVSWVNEGINDVAVPLLQVNSTAPFSTDPNTIPMDGEPQSPDSGRQGTQLFGSSDTFLAGAENDGPPGILMAGQGGLKRYFAYRDTTVAPITIWTELVGQMNDGEAFSWADATGVRDATRREGADFDALVEQLDRQFGTTWPDYLGTLTAALVGGSTAFSKATAQASLTV